MSTEAQPQTPETLEQQLCTSCTAPNEPTAKFCVKCGAPLNPLSMIAPFERLFAEGYIYREAANHPRRLVTVLGIWLIFGLFGSGGLLLILIGLQPGGDGWIAPTVAVGSGAAVVAVSVALIWKTTRNYLTRKRAGHKGTVVSEGTAEL